jgi:proteic killer suppression protein
VTQSFRDGEAAKIFRGEVSKSLPVEIQTVARRKLFYLNNAQSLQDLLAPPGDRLEKLTGNRLGQHSIRINNQWRICFIWQDGGALGVEIVDYH